MAEVEVLVQRLGEPERRVVLTAGTVSIGRTEDNGLVLPDVGVSRRHARLQIDGNGVLIEDLGSGNGTWHAGKRVERMQLKDGDHIYIDPFNLLFRVQETEAPTPPPAGARLVTISGARLEPVYVLKRNGTTMGRSNQRDVVMYDPAASRLQAEVTFEGGGWWLTDHGSINGTFVNGERAKRQRLRDGDRVRVGNTELRFEEDAPPAPAPAPAPVARPAPVAPRGPQAEQVTVAIPRAQGRPPAPAPVPAPAAPAAPTAGRRVLLVLVALFTAGGLLVSAGAIWAAFNQDAIRDLLSASRALPPIQATPSPSPEVLAGLREGKSLFFQRQYLEALARFYAVRKLDPENPEVDRMVNLSAEFLAFQVMRDDLLVRTTSPEDKAAALQHAVALGEAAAAGHGDPDAAIEALHRALLFFPGDAKATALLARVRPLATGAAGGAATR